MQINCVAYRLLSLAVWKLPNFPGQDRLEVCLALLGSLHCSRFGLSSVWLKDRSQLTGFDRMIASCSPNMAAKSKRGQNKTNFVQQSN